MADTRKVHITGFWLVRNAVPRRSELILATFDVSVAGVFEFKNWNLILKNKGEIVARSPRVNPMRINTPPVVQVLDKECLEDITDAALEAFDRAGGVAEWPETNPHMKEPQHV